MIKNMRTLSFAAAMVCGMSAAIASTTALFPNPQQISGEGVAFTSTGATYRLTGAADADADAVAALSQRLDISDSGTVEIVIGESGDAAIAAYEGSIPDQTQGYYLSVSAGSVVIAGRDAEGTYYGVQSFLQLTSMAEVPAVSVTDYPTTPVRGVIEGYYGNPWSHEDCMDMYEFFDHNRMNIFIYGPKNDPYHKAKWAEPYPEDQAAGLSELAREGLRHKVKFVWAMHPGNAIEGENMAKAKAKFEMMYDLGIRQFGVFFDDIGGENVQAQVAYLNYLNKEVVKAHDDVAPLIVCPTEYCISFAGGWNTDSKYLPTLGENLDPDIEIMWTGAGVVDMNQASAAEWFTGKTGRKPFIWLNYPVTDYGYVGGPLLMSPYQPAAANMCDLSTAFCSNPMEYYEASKVALYGIGDYTWNPEAYDPWTNWEQALQYLMPEHTDAFRTYCYSNFYYPSNTHGLVVAYDETPEFTVLTDRYGEHNAESATEFNAYFDKQIATADELLGIENNRLVTEIKEWIEVYRMQGERGLQLDGMRTALAEQNGPAFIEAYKKYTALTDSAESHLSRAGWDVRNFLPKSAPQFVEPFIKSTAIKYAEAFREGGYDYPSDLFPAQIIDNGTYYILYKGRLLSNGSGAAADTPSRPTFRTAVDDINSARQSWNIRYDMETGRYSITSVYDDRYVNEVGNFGVNAYSNEWNTYTITPLGGLYAIQNGGRGGSNFWTVNGAGQVLKGSNTSYNVDNFMFQIIPVSQEITPAPEGFKEGDYYLLNSNDEVLRRMTSDNSLQFSAMPEKPTRYYKWTLSVDPVSKRIKIAQGGYFINEKGALVGGTYYPEWNSYNIFTQGEKLAIQNAERSGTNFWLINDQGKITNSADLTLVNAFDSFRLRPVEEENAIEEVAADNAADNTAYDLQGRRVASPKKGIYIINGQKVLVK